MCGASDNQPRYDASMSDPDFYEQGIDLFNQGRFFECHEAWEEIWKRSDGEAKLFYQGLIQAAVAILHAQRGNLEGARSLHQKAREKLDPLADEHMGIALGEMRVALANFIEVVTAGVTNPLPAPPLLKRVGSRRK